MTAAPTVAGAAARAVTAFAVSPMELIRVRVQGSAAPAGVSYTQQLMSTVRSIHAQGEVRSLHLAQAIGSASWWHELKTESILRGCAVTVCDSNCLQYIFDADILIGNSLTGEAYFAGSGRGQVPQLLAWHGRHAGQGCPLRSCILVRAGASAVHHAAQGCLCINSTGTMPHCLGCVPILLLCNHC